MATNNTTELTPLELCRIHRSNMEQVIDSFIVRGQPVIVLYLDGSTEVGVPFKLRGDEHEFRGVSANYRISMVLIQVVKVYDIDIERRIIHYLE